MNINVITLLSTWIKKKKSHQCEILKNLTGEYV
jgi:hypothetical protein